MSEDFLRERSTAKIAGISIDRISGSEASELICHWATLHSPHAVLAANVHMTMEAVDDSDFKVIMDEADLVVADGRPLFWVLRWRGFADAHHVRGQDLVLAVCQLAEQGSLTVGFYGTTEKALETAARNLRKRFPRLNIVYSFSPPFRTLAQQEDQQIIDAINASDVQILFVAMGCPKQEKWIASHMSKLNTVMIGAGAAIDMIGEHQPTAPRWMQTSGLEWAFRFASDPVRLWRRYITTNLRFVGLLAAETLFATLPAQHSTFSRRRK